MAVIYEWDYETVDENGDIIDHNHADKLSQYSEADITGALVLIRESGDEINGTGDRNWAYVVDGKLPEYFEDAAGCKAYKVPERYARELDKYINRQNKQQ